MPDYILREAAIEALREETQNPYVVHGPQAYGAGIYGAQKIIENLPAVDVVPALPATWTMFDEDDAPFIGACSRCGATGNLRNKYCHNCGSRMDRGENHAD